MDEKKNNTTERPAPKAPESAPVRRVGTLTLGVCLIACGVLFLCYFFVPHFNWDLALKIAPAAGLILLGCEVLYFAARPQRWKYDFLSVLLCIVLMVSAFGGACLMAAFDFALHREEFWIEYDARQERDLDDAESDRLRLDLDEGTGPDLDEENEDSSAASHTEVCAIQKTYHSNTKDTFYRGHLSGYTECAPGRWVLEEKSVKANRHGICHHGGSLFAVSYITCGRSSRCRPAPGGLRPWHRCRPQAH